MSDFEKVMAHLRGVPTDEYAQGEISDACARVISSWYCHGGDTDIMRFVSTGAIQIAPSELWHKMCYEHYNIVGDDDKLALDFLGTYMQNRADKGPVEGWKDMWL
jgi:hypothetical protein